MWSDDALLAESRRPNVNRLLRLLCLGLVPLLLQPVSAKGAASDGQALFNKANKLQADRNYKEAYEAYREVLLGDHFEDHHWEAVSHAVNCLKRLNRDSETDAFREEVVRKHPDSWQVLQVVARSYNEANHTGFMVSGKFHRGHHRGGGQYMNSVERDRVRALQLFEHTIHLSEKLRPSQRASIYYNIAQSMFANRRHHGAWALQALTDTSKLPDYEEGYPHRYHYQPGNRGAPVDPEGTPVYYDLPATYEEAKNDGERWRWLLWEAMEHDENYTDDVYYQWAQFLHSQFGVQTMAQYRWFWRTHRSLVLHERHQRLPGPCTTFQTTRPSPASPTGCTASSCPMIRTSSGTSARSPTPSTATWIRPSSRLPRSTRTAASTPRPRIRGANPSSASARATTSIARSA